MKPSDHFPTLKEICLNRLATINPRNIIFTGVPPHLIRQILRNVGPKDLIEIQDNSPNSKIPGFNDILEELWRVIVLKKFWVGKRDPLVLPPGATWRKYYDQKELEFQEKIHRPIIKKHIKEETKTKKFIDPSEINQGTRKNSTHGSRLRSSSTSGMGRLAQDFYKNYRRK